ncbi:MAG: hypothetical protein V3V08_16660 [Nannocystaceae bacterium]
MGTEGERSRMWRRHSSSLIGLSALALSFACSLPSGDIGAQNRGPSGLHAASDPSAEGEPASNEGGSDSNPDSKSDPNSAGDSASEEAPALHPAADSCAAYCDVRLGCGQASVGCQGECESRWEAERAQTGDLCAEGWSVYVACQASLDCEAYTLHQASTPDELPTYACENAQVSYLRACERWKTVWFPCSDGTSISDTRLCDGRADCPDGDDERAGALCFQCRSGSVVSRLRLCDGIPDCVHGSDEGPVAGCADP